MSRHDSVLCLALSTFMLIILTMFYVVIVGKSQTQYPALDPEGDSNGFSLMMNGFHPERIFLMREILAQYCKVPALRKVYINWGGDPSQAPATSNFTCDVPIEVLISQTSSLTARFDAPKSLETSSVLIADDDILVDPQDVQFVFDAFERNPNRLVGIFGRDFDFVENSDGKKVLKYVNRVDSYSVLLTKFLFVNRKYLDAFRTMVPRATMKYIDEVNNCEDIALNFIVTIMGGPEPLAVNVTAKDFGDSRAYTYELDSSATGRQDQEDMLVSAGKQTGLSFRSTHKDQRSICLQRFQQDFGGLFLKKSHATVTPYGGEQVLCRNGPDWIDCAKAGRDMAHRKATSRYAYVSLVAAAKPSAIEAANCWARRLRTLGTPHDIVLVFINDGRDEAEILDLFPSFSRVKLVKGVDSSLTSSKPQFNKFWVWELTEYEKVVYMDYDVLVMNNVDHLFSRPDFSAVPDIFTGDKFNSGVFVTSPSKSFAKRMNVEMGSIYSYNKGDQGILNRWFDTWYLQDEAHRLPFAYNFMAYFPSHYNMPAWFSLENLETYVGKPEIVHFANPWHKPWLPIGNESDASYVYKQMWRDSCNSPDFSVPETSLSLRQNARAESRMQRASSRQLRDARPTIAFSLNNSKLRPASSTEYFATVYSGNIHLTITWAYSLRRTGTSHKLVIVAPSSTSQADLGILESCFDSVIVKGDDNEMSSVLELFAQTQFSKLVYIHPSTLFVHNMDELFRRPSLSALPASYPPDKMSGNLMVMVPDRSLHRSLKNHLKLHELESAIPFEALNDYFHDWYLSSSEHRISPSFHADIFFKPNLAQQLEPMRSISFDTRFDPVTEKVAYSKYSYISNLHSLWISTACDAKKRLPEMTALELDRRIWSAVAC